MIDFEMTAHDWKVALAEYLASHIEALRNDPSLHAITLWKPLKGERFFSTCGMVETRGESHDWSFGPRFILRPPRKVTRKRIIFEQLADEPRLLCDEWGEGATAIFFLEESAGAYIPYSRREETFEVEVDS